MKLFLSLISLIFLISCNKNFSKIIAKDDSKKCSQLFNQISKQDSIFFNYFNNRNFDSIINFLSENLEVFQDNIGVRNKKQTLESFKEVFSKDYILIRTILPETVEVYPIKNFGAIQTGQHRFSHFENGKLESIVFKFLTIWEYKNNNWMINKIVTYDH